MTQRERQGARIKKKKENRLPRINNRITTTSIFKNESSNISKQGVDNEYRYIVKYKKGSLPHHRFALSKTLLETPKVVKVIERLNAEVITSESKINVEAIQNNEFVEYIEEDHRVYMMDNPINYTKQENIPYGIDLVNALKVPTTSASNQTICIIDSGYDLGHPDLQSSNVRGYNGNLPWDRDTNSHGTHVAGTIAALGNNNQGVIGVIPDGTLNLYIVRVFGSGNNWAWSSDLVAAMEECLSAGSNIINMSLGGTYSKVIEDGCNDIYENEDVLLIASAGNEGTSSYIYPASLDSVMSVASIKPNLDRSQFSQHNDQVNIAAPGAEVLSTIPRSMGAYGYMSGTSMAAPHVAGVAALLWSHNRSLKATEIRHVLEQTATDLGIAGRDDEYGYGLVNAKAAYDFLSGDDTFTPTVSPTDFFCQDGQKIFNLKIFPDEYPAETSWVVRTLCEKEIVYEGNEFGILACVDHMAYMFTIYDSYGDGIIAPGGYELYYDNILVRNGGQFNEQESLTFGNNSSFCSPTSSSLSPSETPSIFPTERPSQYPLETISTIVSLGFKEFSFTLNPFNGMTNIFERKSEEYLFSALNNTIEIVTISVKIISQHLLKKINEGLNQNHRYLNEDGGLLVEMNITVQIRSSIPTSDKFDTINTDITPEISDSIIGVFQDGFSEYRAFILSDYQIWKGVTDRSSDSNERVNYQQSMPVDNALLYFFGIVFLVLSFVLYFALTRKDQQKKRVGNERRMSEPIMGRGLEIAELDLSFETGSGLSSHEESSIHSLHGTVKYDNTIKKEDGNHVDISEVSPQTFYDLAEISLKTSCSEDCNLGISSIKTEESDPIVNENKVEERKPKHAMMDIEIENDENGDLPKHDVSLITFY